MIETLIVGLAIVAALLYVIRSLARSSKGETCNGCGTGSCSLAKGRTGTSLPCDIRIDGEAGLPGCPTATRAEGDATHPGADGRAGSIETAARQGQAFGTTALLGLKMRRQASR